MARKTSLLTATLALLVGGSALHEAAARPIVPSERRYLPFDSELPACNDGAALSEIATRFHEREVQYWRTGLDITGFEQPAEIGFRSNGLDYSPRRYCVAHAIMSDAKVREVSYSISKDLGPIGISFGVSWCVEGLDRFHADAPDCKMAQP